ncbi:hypothetical protein [Bradyrhizobium sp.]|uniref:hypothetical protein n=1 Tax=Bradyrhizobium sp. TaxID=376 RepID=UPI002E08CE7A|nr:hypothetical protein [Bradyrhizobium sp.]
MRRIHLPAQHLARADVEHFCVVVVPFLVGKIDFDIEQRDVFQMLRGDERGAVRIDIDALAAGDLHQALPGHVGVVIDLRVRRGDQDAFLVAFRNLEVRYLGDDFLKHAVDQFTVTGVNRGDVAHVEPEPAARDGVDDFAATEIADIALTPQFFAAAGAGLHQAVMLARIAFDQFCQVVHRKRRRLVHLVLEPDRLMGPQLRMRLVPFGEDLVRRHCRAPAG